MSVSRSNNSDATGVLLNDAEKFALPPGYTDLIDIVPVGIFTLDPGQRIRYLNPAATELLGLDPDDALGENCEEVLRCTFCGPECSTCLSRQDGQVRRGFPSEITRKDGSRRAVIIDSVPLVGGNVAVLIRDVTESERLRRALQDRWIFHGLVCTSEPMKEVVGQIRDVAPYDSTVLILGESGTGKELVARSLHAESQRASKPFVVVNCSAYSETLLESELFGHVRGAFTGADRNRRGRFELADGGTVLLDEVGEVSPKMQVKLLRVLQEREIERVGESHPRAVNLRILASTNRDLHQAVRAGTFREDLYYRLNVFTIQLPPLRDRKEDIPALVDYLIERLAERTGKDVKAVSDEVMARLLAHAWPGNVRELENVLESAVVRARADVVTAVELPTLAGAALPGATLEERMRDALRRTAGCVTRAARILGVHRTTLWRHMRELNVTRDEFLMG